MKTSIKIRKMKKKILLGSVASLFAIATVFNMGLLNFNKQSDATLDAIAVMVEAQNEINPDCINGCVLGEGGCVCFKYYISLAEYDGW